MSEVKHSPLPWRRTMSNPFFGEGWFLQDSADQVIAGMWGRRAPLSEEDSLFIVTACNSHYALTERIKALEEAARALCDAITEYLIVVPDGPVARMEALKPVLDAHAAARALLEEKP